VISTTGGTFAVNGNIVSSGAYGAYCNGGTLTLTGDISTSAGAGVLVSFGTFVLVGRPLLTGDSNPFYITGGTAQWNGARSLAAGELAKIYQAGGTLDLQTTPLVLTNSGFFFLLKTAGILNSTGASVTNQTAAAQSIIKVNSGSLTLIGPTLPAVGNVLTDVDTYGYAGGLLTPTLTQPNTQYVLDSCPDYGVAGTGGAKTATIPAVGNVRKGTAYGVNATGSTGTMPARLPHPRPLGRR
jgi:hypothetical protein